MQDVRRDPSPPGEGNDRFFRHRSRSLPA